MVKTHQTVYFGNALDVTGCVMFDDYVETGVDLVVTSPPYFDLVDYGHPEQIGFNQSHDRYLYSIFDVFANCWDLLNPGCRFCVVIGDSYISDDKGYRIIPTHSDIIEIFKDFDNSLYLGSIIWQKISTTNSSGGGSWLGSIYYPKNGYITYENEFILVFRKKGKERRPDEATKEMSRLTKQERSDWFRGIWKIPGARQNKGKAVFPLEIPRRLIKMYSFVGETVLDPFIGSGTTLQAADELGRNGVGVEIVAHNKKIIQQKVPTVEFIEAEEYVFDGVESSS